MHKYDYGQFNVKYVKYNLAKTVLLYCDMHVLNRFFLKYGIKHPQNSANFYDGT